MVSSSDSLRKDIADINLLKIVYNNMWVYAVTTNAHTYNSNHMYQRYLTIGLSNYPTTKVS